MRLYQKSLQSYLNANNFDIIVSLCGKEIAFFYKLKTTGKKIGELHFNRNFKYQYLTSRNNSKLIQIIGRIQTQSNGCRCLKDC